MWWASRGRMTAPWLSAVRCTRGSSTSLCLVWTWKMGPPQRSYRTTGTATPMMLRTGGLPASHADLPKHQCAQNKVNACGLCPQPPCFGLSADASASGIARRQARTVSSLAGQVQGNSNYSACSACIEMPTTAADIGSHAGHARSFCHASKAGLRLIPHALQVPGCRGLACKLP